MICIKNLIIFGPIGSVGGVKTHVELLTKILGQYAGEILITKGIPFLKVFLKRFCSSPELVIYNLSIYQNTVLKHLVAHLLLRTKRTRYILHLHGGDFGAIGFMHNKVIRYFLKFHFNSFDKIFCLTEEQYRFVEGILPGSDKISRIFNYIEIPDKEKISKEQDIINFLYIGRLHPDKGIMLAVETLMQLKKYNWRFWIIGAGELEEELANFNDERVVFLGKKFGEEKDEYLKKSHVFLLPSSWDEGLPYALLEAASFGLALVASDNGAIDQVISHNVNGLLIDPANKESFKDEIERLLLTPELVFSMGAQARQTAEQKFSLQELSAIYEQLLKAWF